MSNAPRADHWITDWEFSERYPVYTRANAGEVLPDPSSPLNVTLVWNKGLNIGWREGYVEHLGTHLSSEIDETMPEIIGNFGGYHYTNFSMTELNGASPTWPDRAGVEPPLGGRPPRPTGVRAEAGPRER